MQANAPMNRNSPVLPLQVAADVGAERGAAKGQRDKAHHLAEYRTGAISGDIGCAKTETDLIVCRHAVFAAPY